jgi:DNA invertase Pin-like site-specific DNA recombinase
MMAATGAQRARRATRTSEPGPVREPRGETASTPASSARSGPAARKPKPAGHLVGYARVSTAEQDPALQLDALAVAGCWRVFTDHASGSREDRPELVAALDSLRPGDTLVVCRLGRLGRSLPHLIDTVTGLRERGVGFWSVTEAIDTTTAGGGLVFPLFGALAEFERQLIRDRTLAGLAAARARGRVGGRPRTMTSAKLRLARAMRGQDPPVSLGQIAAELGLPKSTVARNLTAPPVSPTTANDPAPAGRGRR